MKLEKASITILINREKTTIEIRDENARIVIAAVELTPDQLSSALSRLSHTPCSVTVCNLSLVGKKQENDRFEFELPEDFNDSFTSRDTKADELNEMCLKALAEAGKGDWVPDKYYGSRDSFLTKNGKRYASAIIRRWV